MRSINGRRTPRPEEKRYFLRCHHLMGASSDTSDDATYKVAIQEDRDDEYDALSDGNPVDINLEQHEPVGNDPKSHRADHAANNGTSSTHQAGATEHHCCYHS